MIIVCPYLTHTPHVSIPASQCKYYEQMRWKAKVNSIMNAFIHKEFNGMRYKLCIITAPNWIILKLQQIILQSITWSEQTYNQIRGTHHTLGWPIRAQQHRKTRLCSRTEGNQPSRSCSSQSGFCGWQLRDVDIKPPTNPYSPESPNRWHKRCCPLLGRKPVKKYLFILSPNPTLHFQDILVVVRCVIHHPSILPFIAWKSPFPEFNGL